ncbi:PREDICTED: uncharacterized protein LOC109164921 [Ipomoea nil]|uniref:uncharacterized protein LOC109164921 n=1 Tax=Ipomoea nil TaxID=35883 RepID=UPI000900EAFA|nr:PREDICTED: uncharacterized protein LOC109164921 [Ipomoea nil]
MEDYYGLGSRNRGKLAAEYEEFQEEEVWAANNTERETSPSKVMMMRKSSAAASWRLPVAPRTGGRERRCSRAEQSSAPVSIPDWSKIYCRKSAAMKGDSEEEEEDDDDNEMVPPHEYIARRLARTQIASFSMCEGVGRTLKGRDLSKLRNAILTKTGFLEK